MFEIDDCVSFVTSKASKEIADAFNEKLSSYNITRVQWIALYFLGKYECINQSELAEKMNIKTSTMVRLIDRMETEGYVLRTKDTNDRRITNLYLTKLGLKRREEIIEIGQRFSDFIIKDISDEDLLVFKNVMNKIVENSKSNF